MISHNPISKRSIRISTSPASLLYPILLIVPLLWLVRFLNLPRWGWDFYPLYYGAQRVLAGQSLYGAQATHDLMQRWGEFYAQGGIAYPLPFVLLVVPLTLLTVPLATAVWTALGFAAAYPSVFITQHTGWRKLLVLLLPFAFWPLFRGVELAQATLLWTGLAAILVLGTTRKWPNAVAICAVLLLLKPQNGLLFALYGLYWLLRYHRRHFALSVALGVTLLGVSLAVQPHWIQGWIAQVRAYDHYVTPHSLLPIGLIPLLACLRLRLHLVAKIAIAQVILFPITDMYSTLPLLLAWSTFSPPLALVGASMTWLPIIGGLPHYLHSSQIWIFALAPLLIVALREGRPRVTGSPTLNEQGSARRATPPAPTDPMRA